MTSLGSSKRTWPWSQFLPVILLAGIAPAEAGEPTVPPNQERQFEIAINPHTRELLVGALGSPERAFRLQAVVALRDVGNPEMAPSVARLLDDPVPAVRAETITTLEALLPSSELAPLLVRACGDPSERVVRRALGALARMPGAEGLQTLLDVRSRVPPSLQAVWADALAEREAPPPASAVEDLLTDPDPEIRAAAAGVLSRHPRVLPAADKLKLLSDEDPLVRARVLESLADVADAPEVRAAVVKALDDPTAWVRRAALHALEKSPPELSRLAGALADPDSTVRLAALSATSHVGGQAAVKALLGCFADPDLHVARAAADQAAQIADAEARDSLINSLEAPEEQRVAMAVRALGRTGDLRAVSVLTPLVQHPSPWVRTNVYEAFGRLGDASVVPLLITRAKSEPPGPRAALNTAFGRLGDLRALPHLLADINYPDVQSKGLLSRLAIRTAPPPPYPDEQTAVASAAIRSLGQIGDPAAVEPLLAVSLDMSRNGPYFENIAWSLGKLGDARAGRVLTTLGIDGMIGTDRFVLQMPDAARIEALRAIGRLDLKPLAPRIVAMDPLTCSLAVRKAAAETLHQLTGDRYRARPPVRIAQFVIQSVDALDLRAMHEPIVVRVADDRDAGRPAK